jgi:hypothetical protein
MIFLRSSIVWQIILIVGLVLQFSSTNVMATTVEKHGKCSKKSTWHLTLSKMSSSRIKTQFRGDSPSYVGQTWKIVAYNRNNKKIFEMSVSTHDDNRQLLFTNNNNNNNSNNSTNNNNNNNNDDDSDDDEHDQGEYFEVWFPTSNLKGKDVISIHATASKTKEVCKANATYSW